MSARRSAGLLLMSCLALAGAVGAEPTLKPAAGDEVLVYRWKVEGIKGLILRLVAPGKGEGSLTTVLNDQGHFETELHMSAESRRKGDFWRYGSSVDLDARRSLRAWTAQKIGDKERAREADLEDDDVIDLASGILLVRRDPPTLRRRMRIWSNGRLYPVVIEPLGEGVAEFRGRRTKVRRYAISGYRVPGEREWKGGLELHLADDESATPVEMYVLNKGVRARLRLDEEASQFGLPQPERAALGSRESGGPGFASGSPQSRPPAARAAFGGLFRSLPAGRIDCRPHAGRIGEEGLES